MTYSYEQYAKQVEDAYFNELEECAAHERGDRLLSTYRPDERELFADRAEAKDWDRAHEEFEQLGGYR